MIKKKEFRKKYGLGKIMEENEINLYFFKWFSKYSKETNLEYPFSQENSINPLEKRMTPWKTLEDEIIESEYPPQEELK